MKACKMNVERTEQLNKKTIKKSCRTGHWEGRVEFCFKLIQTHSCSQHSPAVCLLASLPVTCHGIR